HGRHHPTSGGSGTRRTRFPSSSVGTSSHIHSLASTVGASSTRRASSAASRSSRTVVTGCSPGWSFPQSSHDAASRSNLSLSFSLIPASVCRCDGGFQRTNIRSDLLPPLAEHERQVSRHVVSGLQPCGEIGSAGADFLDLILQPLSLT